jgi:hypothetical protein
VGMFNAYTSMPQMLPAGPPYESATAWGNPAEGSVMQLGQGLVNDTLMDMGGLSEVGNGMAGSNVQYWNTLIDGRFDCKR